MTSTPTRKRSHASESVGSGGGLLPEFDRVSGRVAKRGRLEDTANDDHTATNNNNNNNYNNNYKSTAESSTSSTFLHCHSMMLHSLYNHDATINKNSIIPSPTTWKQIESFLSRRQALLALVQKSMHLSALLAESISICTKPPLTAPLLNRMNTSLKTESKLSFSFITQSQQGQIHSLTLNSPTATHIKRDVLSPFYKMNYSGMGGGTSNQKRIRGYIHNRQKSSTRTGGTTQADREMMHRDNNTFNSMNLVTSILQKRCNAAVLSVRKERKPFVPLLADVKEHIHMLGVQQKELEERLKKEFDVADMTEQQLRLAARASHAGFGFGYGEGDGSISSTYAEGRNDIARIQCRLGLWRALGASLESVICTSL